MVEASSYDATLKVMVVGDSKVGKTSLVRRFVNQSFSAQSVPTVGVDFQLASRQARVFYSNQAERIGAARPTRGARARCGAASAPSPCASHARPPRFGAMPLQKVLFPPGSVNTTVLCEFNCGTRPGKIGIARSSRAITAS